MALWDFTHDVLNMHVYLLPSIIVGVAMLVTGFVHGKNQKNRQEEFNEELRANSPETPEEAAR